MEANSQFCIVPKTILSAGGLIVFTTLSELFAEHADQPRGAEGFAPSTSQRFWRFLKGYPDIFLVLLPDDGYSIRRLRSLRLAPSLGARFIGATNPAREDPYGSIWRWLNTFGDGRRFAILDSRVECYPKDLRQLVPINPELGITDMDLLKIVDLLKSANELLANEVPPLDEALCLAANLSLCGQTAQARLITASIVEQVGCLLQALSRNGEAGEGADLERLSGHSECETYYRLANALGVRLRVFAEPASR
jgi:hypothetical protein